MITQITVTDLHNLIVGDAVKVVDASWALDGTDMRTLFESDHIPGAQFFDLESVSDHSTALPHMAPTPEVFAEAVGRMGIRANDPVVIYDRQGLFSAARVWWTFRLMGHKDVRVLRGGLPAWKADGFPIETVVMTPQVETYMTTPQNKMIIDMKVLAENLQTPCWRVLDARPAARFNGSVAEPRAGLRSGHMPGAQSLPFATLIAEGVMKPESELKSIFEGLGVTPETVAITTCGSGVTAAIISMALHEVGHTKALLYDGSWSEWGQETQNTPVVR